MTRKCALLAAVLALAVGISWVVPAGAQDLFTTQDYRQDRELWTDPAYYRHNTIAQIRNMQVAARYGEEGEGVDAFVLASPYPYTTAWEHYQAWLREAEGGTRHTIDTLPNWDGRWETDGGWLTGQDLQASTVASVLTRQYREYFVQAEKAAAEGRDWWPSAFCLPTDFFSVFTRGPNEFLVRPHQVVILSEDNVGQIIRWIHTDPNEHVREEFQYPRQHGESVGFWDGDTLIAHTNQIRGWKAVTFEYSDSLETVERYRRVGDVIEGEITLYDPVAFLRPLHAKVSFSLSEETGPEFRPLYNTCTDTNGPSQKVFFNAHGILDERLPGDPLYWDPTNRRPWADAFALGE